MEFRQKCKCCDYPENYPEKPEKCACGSGLSWGWYPAGFCKSCQSPIYLMGCIKCENEEEEKIEKKMNKITKEKIEKKIEKLKEEFDAANDEQKMRLPYPTQRIWWDENKNEIVAASPNCNETSLKKFILVLNQGDEKFFQLNLCVSDFDLWAAALVQEAGRLPFIPSTIVRFIRGEPVKIGEDESSYHNGLVKIYEIKID